jgi:hypothetical protein
LNPSDVPIFVIKNEKCRVTVLPIGLTNEWGTTIGAIVLLERVSIEIVVVEVPWSILETRDQIDVPWGLQTLPVCASPKE